MSALDGHLPAYKRDFAYQFDNEIILNWYPRRIMELTDPASKVLELGVGHGYSCNHFSEYYRDYTVIDGSRSVIDNFRANYPASPAKIIETYFETFDTSETYDVIIMGFVLEHVEDPAIILDRFRALLAPGGRCFVGVPNAASLHRRFGHEAGLLADMNALGAADLVLGHRRYYTVESLGADMQAAGYRVVRREGIFLKPLTTGQLLSLDLPPQVLEGMCRVGVDYPELSAGLLFEAEVSS